VDKCDRSGAWTPPLVKSNAFVASNRVQKPSVASRTPSGCSRAAAKWLPRAAEIRERKTMPGAARRTQVETVDDYIAGCVQEVRPILRKIRATIRRAVPQATELMSYRMPAFKLNGIIMYFGVFQRHIGVFPPVRGTPALVKAVKPYAGPKGNLKFPLAGRIPYALIARIARQRAKDNTNRVVNTRPGSARKRARSA
jgi:uncharacterized protein YdhG (YjbR/CyaY superfamily)